MAKCVLNPRKAKHRRCEQIAGRSYHICLVRGSWPHNIVQCSYREGEPGPNGLWLANTDVIDLRAGTVTPVSRQGQSVVPKRPVYSAQTGEILG